MKKILFVAIAAITMATVTGCNFTQNATNVANYLAKNGKVESITTGSMVKTTAKLSNLWNAPNIKKYCPEAVISIDIATGELTAVTNCNIDSLKTLLKTPAGKLAVLLSGAKK